MSDQDPKHNIEGPITRSKARALEQGKQPPSKKAPPTPIGKGDSGKGNPKGGPNLRPELIPVPPETKAAPPFPPPVGRPKRFPWSLPPNYLRRPRMLAPPGPAGGNT